MKKIAIIPTLLTLGNAICGFTSIVCASKIQANDPSTYVFFAYSAWLLFAGMVFDMLDGVVARRLRTASDFGGQLDSLCDAVSFGAAPAFLLLKLGQAWQLPMYRQALGVVAALFLCCAILRLARFNTENTPDPSSHKRFRGLPSPAAAGCVASLAILRGQVTIAHLTEAQVLTWVRVWGLLGTLVIALLMVSRFSYPHLANQLLRGRRHISHVVQLILVLGLLILTHEIALFVLFWGYALAMPLRQIILRALKQSKVTTPELDDIRT